MILVFCAVYRLEDETIKAIFDLAYDGALAYYFQRDNPYQDGHRNILHQYQKGRDFFLSGDFTHMLTIESDIIPPPETLDRLLALDADLAYGQYAFRASPDVINVYGPTGESLSVRPWDWTGKRVLAVTGGGLGCVLIKRRVLERLNFRLSKPETADCDHWFSQDATAAGFDMRADLSIKCGHKTPQGVILWPKPIGESP